MIYRRSGTDMDAAAGFFPQSFLSGLRGRLGRLGDAGEFGDDFSSNKAPMDFSNLGGDAGTAWPVDYGYTPFDYPAPPAPSSVPASSQAQAGWSWQGIMDKATAAGRDLLLSNNPGDAAQKLRELNAARNAANLPPLPPGSVPVTGGAPRAPSQAGASMLGLVLAGSLAGGLLFSRAKRTSRRRR